MKYLIGCTFSRHPGDFMPPELAADGGFGVMRVEIKDTGDRIVTAQWRSGKYHVIVSASVETLKAMLAAAEAYKPGDVL